MKIVVLGGSSRGSELVGKSSGFVRELEARGHEVLILQPSRPRRERRAKPRIRPTNTRLYRSVSDLKVRYSPKIRNADVVIVGSKVPCSLDVGAWVTRVARGVTAFYDNDIESTLTELKGGASTSVSPALIPKYKLYLSVGSADSAKVLQSEFRSPMARTLDPEMPPENRAAEVERFLAEAMSGRLMA